MSSAPSSDIFDYIIVGGGTAGCVLANRLSADPKVRVLLLEAGGKDDYIWVRIPVGYLYCMGNPRTDWCFRTEGQKGLGGKALNYPRGRVLGGCSSINGMIYVRGQRRDYDRWRQLGNAGWGADDVVSHFHKLEDFAAGDLGIHGAGGEVRIEKQRLHWPLLDAIADAAAALGIPKRGSITASDDDGVGYFSVTQRRGWRWSAATAFLKPALTRSNLAVATKAFAQRIVFEGRRAAGVEYLQDGALKAARANASVILAAGAIGSPHLLEVSGVGDANRLKALHIPVVYHAPGVGENLQDHLQLRCIYKVTGAATLNERVRTLFGKALIGAEYALFRTGPMSMAPSQLGLFARSDSSVETPDVQFHIQPLSLDRFGEPLHSFPAFTIAPCNLRPHSRGSVHLTSPDVARAPKIDPNYLSDPYDRLVAARALRLTRRIVAQEPLRRYAPVEYVPGPHFETDEDLARAAGQVGSTIFHPVGTARMGQDAGAVVDERLRVRGLEGLRVIDASVMPTITSGNTNAPVMVIAHKGAAMALEDAQFKV
ncbi:MAG: GMC family oxidoreductase N-terminal domain-containing protein [Rhodospirillaceae bacterium]|nr:GMC family oxidoreductase N-terminal domain-containing protein [Rhodospirillaceae bacterium]